MKIKTMFKMKINVAVTFRKIILTKIKLSVKIFSIFLSEIENSDFKLGNLREI